MKLFLHHLTENSLRHAQKTPPPHMIDRKGGVFVFFGLLHMLQGFFLLGYLSGGNSFPMPLSVEDEQRFLKEYAQGHDEAKNILIERNLRLVAHVAKKYSNHSKDSEDLISVGTIGLIKAITSYKPDKGTRLATYAARCIDNAILAQWRFQCIRLKIMLLLNDAEKFNIGHPNPEQLESTADKLRYYRYKKGLLQKDVAEYAGIERTTYTAYEANERDYYPVDVLVRIPIIFFHIWWPFL